MSLDPMSTLSMSAQRGLAIDTKSLDQLNSLAGRDSRAALQETARQFEALFMRQLLKSMREATMKSGLMDNEATNLGTQLLDEQLALKMTGLPGGLSEMIERQLMQQGVTAPAGLAGPMAPQPAAAPLASVANPVASGSRVTGQAVPQPTPAQAQFVSQHRAAAMQVERESGIPAAFMIGQAAHETGWGRSPIRNADGSSSFNLFGIKAGPSWRGRVAEITTTEYINGEPRRVTARFRAYESYAESFRDYARLISQSPRYTQVMQSLYSPRSFSEQLQAAGYATDPRYAEKLTRVINTTLNVKRALG
ncbi:MAG: flagellar assembly peptidoglycan hydrolase FlgJ [Burkholderiaceae bacterium]|nr:flagellar assembly peptidoglycan hydrolase FlgJ [Burkholderiaceae bacterium]